MSIKITARTLSTKDVPTSVKVFQKKKMMNKKKCSNVSQQ